MLPLCVVVVRVGFLAKKPIKQSVHSTITACPETSVMQTSNEKTAAQVFFVLKHKIQQKRT